MNFLTLLLSVFTLILYIYLTLLHKELVFVTKRKSMNSILFPIFAALLVFSMYLSASSFAELFRGAISALVVLSYIYNNRGLAKNRIVLHSLDNKGVQYEEIDRVVILHNLQSKEIKINFFRKGWRLPLFHFNQSLEELLPFLTKRLKKGTTIDIILNQS